MNKKEQFIRINKGGSKFYYSDRKMTTTTLHREDGPAYEDVDGNKSWFLNGEELTEAEFNARMNPVELTLDEIASKFGVSVEQLKIKK
jgi:hypothetical protein